MKTGGGWQAISGEVSRWADELSLAGGDGTPDVVHFQSYFMVARDRDLWRCTEMGIAGYEDGQRVVSWANDKWTALMTDPDTVLPASDNARYGDLGLRELLEPDWLTNLLGLTSGGTSSLPVTQLSSEQISHLRNRELGAHFLGQGVRQVEISVNSSLGIVDRISSFNGSQAVLVSSVSSAIVLR